jgi:hypothetical protein
MTKNCYALDAWACRLATDLAEGITAFFGAGRQVDAAVLWLEEDDLWPYSADTHHPDGVDGEMIYSWGEPDVSGEERYPFPVPEGPTRPDPIRERLIATHPDMTAQLDFKPGGVLEAAWKVALCQALQAMPAALAGAGAEPSPEFVGYVHRLDRPEERAWTVAALAGEVTRLRERLRRSAHGPRAVADVARVLYAGEPHQRWLLQLWSEVALLQTGLISSDD